MPLDRAILASPLGRPLLRLAVALPLGLALARAAGLAIPDALLWVALGLLLAAVTVGVVRADLGLFARPILAARPTTPGLVALTFDDGPHPELTRKVLELLAAGPHRATFFVIGQRAARHPDLLRDVVAAGHGVGNHTWAHAPWTPALGAATLARELLETNAVLQGATGQPPRWLRAPMGLVTPPVAEAAARAGLDLVGWTATARDGVAWADPEAGFRRLLRHLRPGAILVLHDGVEAGPGREAAVLAVLPRLLAELDARGLRSVTLDDLLGEGPGR